jgi:hypothetical protein
MPESIALMTFSAISARSGLPGLVRLFAISFSYVSRRSHFHWHSLHRMAQVIFHCSQTFLACVCVCMCMCNHMRFILCHLVPKANSVMKTKSYSRFAMLCQVLLILFQLVPAQD